MHVMIKFCTRTCAQIGEVGVIEKVQLTNFMCHSHMVVSFSPNVNFVLGRNGSKLANYLTASMYFSTKLNNSMIHTLHLTVPKY